MQSLIHYRTLLPRHHSLPKKGEKCNPCVRYDLLPMSQVGQSDILNTLHRNCGCFWNCKVRAHRDRSMVLARQFKTEPHLLCDVAPEIQIMFQLGIRIGHSVLCVPHPELDEVFGCALLSEPRRAESAHGVEARFR